VVSINNKRKLKMKNRTETIMPDGVPKYVRCYDNGGTTVKDGSIDRYTVCFTGNYRRKTGGEFVYLAMNGSPFHPQGFGQHGQHSEQIDVNKWGYAPAMGHKNHLGKRIPFMELPEDCRKLVISDYKELWDLK
jgi:hypothetical protein